MRIRCSERIIKGKLICGKRRLQMITSPRCQIIFGFSWLKDNLYVESTGFHPKKLPNLTKFNWNWPVKLQHKISLIRLDFWKFDTLTKITAVQQSECYILEPTQTFTLDPFDGIFCYIDRKSFLINYGALVVMVSTL